METIQEQMAREMARPTIQQRMAQVLADKEALQKHRVLAKALLDWLHDSIARLPVMDDLDRRAHTALFEFKVGQIWAGCSRLQKDENGKEIIVDCDDPTAPEYVQMPQNCVTPGWQERQAAARVKGQQAVDEQDDFA